MENRDHNISETKVAAIYCRVSTYEQGVGDYSSLQGQEDLLKKYCEQKEWEIYKVYKDSKSGTNLERESLNDAVNKKFNIVLATKLDRISRSVKDFLSLDERFRDLGIDVVIATQNIDTTTPSGKMQRTILLAFGEFKRDMIAERTREKLFLQATNGYWGGGHTPLGYDNVNKKLFENSNEVELINKIFEDYLRQPSTKKIAEKLNTEGLRNKIRITKKGGNTGGGKFTTDIIKGILRNKIYIGKIVYNGQEFTGLHKPIVPNELFEKVQKKLDESKKDKYITYEAKSQLTLLGITKCGFCGGHLTESSSKKPDGKKTYYYKCTSSTKFSKRHCPSKAINAKELENFVLKLVKSLGSDKDFFNASMKQLKFNSFGKSNELKKQLQQIEKRIRENQNSLDRVTKFLIDQPNLNESKTFANKITELEVEATLFVEQKRNIVEEIRQLEIQKVDKLSVKSILQNFDELYSYMPYEAKKRLNHLIFKGIRSNLKTGDKGGVIEFKVRADGTLQFGLEQIKTPKTQV